MDRVVEAAPRSASALNAAAAPAVPAYPPISDYALIGDCRTAALISREGSLDWLCLPHFSAPSVFGALLDRSRGGRFSIRPDTDDFSVTRCYAGSTAVLETTFRTGAGAVRLTDLMPMPASAQRLQPMRELLRIVEGLEGRMDLRVQADPRPDYGRQRPQRSARGALGWVWSWGDELLNLCADAPLQPDEEGTGVSGRFEVSAGERRVFSLCYAKAEIACLAPLGDAALARRDATQRWWTAWTQRCTYEGSYREPVLRSAVTLKLLTYALSGAVVAAPTTSLPESLGGERNWDYRYCWLRDAAITMRAFTSLGYMDEGSAFLSWMLHATRLTQPALRVMYDVYGGADLRESTLAHWEGYVGSRPVRVGNDAYRQTQPDVYGNVLFAAYNFVENGGALQRDEARLLGGLGGSVMRQWRRPDHGMWEIPGAPRHYTVSKAMCWIALHCLSELHERHRVPAPKGLRAERAAIGETIETRAFHRELNSYVAEFDDCRVDASLLQLGSLGYVSAGDPRMRGTFELIQRRLNRNGLLYRYEPGYDQLPSGEGAFGLCSFWAIDHLASSACPDAARGAFEHLLSFANDLGLYAEEIDPRDGRALGNFPQAFTHVGLIEAALAIAEHGHPKNPQVPR